MKVWSKPIPKGKEKGKLSPIQKTKASLKRWNCK